MFITFAHEILPVDSVPFFIQPKKHFICELYFPKNHEIGSLDVRKLKQAMRVTAF